ncbi:MAG: GAF domain-containing protein, partial [Deltaproteobacteria bacterium]|nr:GAF domain-containing protein [Deltaproteobacteria bacterium]
MEPEAGSRSPKNPDVLRGITAYSPIESTGRPHPCLPGAPTGRGPRILQDLRQHLQGQLGHFVPPGPQAPSSQGHEPHGRDPRLILQVPGKDQLYWELSRGDKADFFERECVSLPVGTGIAGHVFHTGSPVLSNDPTKDPRWCPDFDKKSGFRTRSLLCVPLKFRGNTIGVIEIINRAEGKFTRADLRLLEVIASQA